MAEITGLASINSDASVMSRWRCAHVIRPCPTRPETNTMARIDSQSVPWIAPRSCEVSNTYGDTTTAATQNTQAINAPAWTPWSRTCFTRKRYAVKMQSLTNISRSPYRIELDESL